MTEAKKPAMRNGVIKRGSTWSYVVRERDPETGTTKPRWVGGFPTEAVAKRERNKALVAVDRGTYVPPTDLTVGAWLDQWIKGHSVELKPTTIAAYKQKIDGYLKPAIGHERLQALSPSRLSALFRQMAESGGKDGAPLSPRSVEYTRAILRKACNDAVVERVLEVNPVVGSKAPRKQGKPKHVTWTAEQQRLFIDAVEESRWSALWVVALGSGMRRGELLALTWSDVDLAGGVLSVEHSVAQIKQQRVVTDTKNHENRKVALDPTTLGKLKAWRKQQAAERLEWGAAYDNPANLVFTWPDGSPVLPDYASKEFVKVQDMVERGEDGKPQLPRMTLHGTRHSHATTLLRAGVPVHIVSKRLGHKDASITLNVYADAIPDDDTRATDVFARLVWGA